MGKHDREFSKEHARFLSCLKMNRRLVFISQIMVLISFFALWEIASRIGWIDSFIFSRPSRMINTMLNMAASGELFRHIFITTGETIAGFLLSTILGTFISIFLWWNKFVRDVSNPFIVIFNSLPKTALAPIIIVWLGNNINAIIATAIMISVVVTILNVLTGFLQVETDKIKLAQTFGATKLQILKKVIIPASIPSIINALKVNVGLSFVGVIVGEFLVAQSGLGFLIMYGSQVFRMDMVMLSIVILCILAALLYQLIIILEKRFLNWS
ncbi:MAG: ABC transporter permease [Defluviitaleaceae bacterium]|nr:ABC transporter permease [Defluviitaleaceae bacterium]